MATIKRTLQLQIEERLGVLLGEPFWHCHRAADLNSFHFGARQEVAFEEGADPGQLAEVGEYALHVQCAWHIRRGDQILVASRDRYEIIDGGTDWHPPGANLCDVKLDSVVRHYCPLTVRSVEAGPAGRLSIALGQELCLELFPDDSLGDEYWRLLRPGKSEPHLVLEGQKLLYGETELINSAETESDSAPAVEVATPVSLADSELVGYRKTGLFLTATIQAWNEETVKVVFNDVIGLVDHDASELSGLVYGAQQSATMLSAIDRYYAETPPDEHGFLLYLFLDHDDMPALEVVARDHRIELGAAPTVDGEPEIPLKSVLDIVRQSESADQGWRLLVELASEHLPSPLWSRLNHISPGEDVSQAREWLVAQLAHSEQTPVRGIYLGLDTLNMDEGAGHNVELATTADCDPAMPTIDWAFHCEWYGQKHLIGGLSQMRKEYKRDEFQSISPAVEYALFLAYSGIVLSEALRERSEYAPALVVWGFHDGDLFPLGRLQPNGFERLAALDFEE